MCKLRWYGIILNFEVFFIEINDVNINVRFNFFMIGLDILCIIILVFCLYLVLCLFLVSWINFSKYSL